MSVRLHVGRNRETASATIAKTRPNLPVIFSTGHADATRLDEYLSKPTVSYLLKPYDIAALIAAIEEVS